MTHRPLSALLVASAAAAFLLLPACGSDCTTTPSSFQGDVVYAGLAAPSQSTGTTDAGATGATGANGGTTLTVSVDSFSPITGNGDGPGGYCGTRMFLVSLGAGCVLHASLGTVYYDNENRAFISAAGTLTSSDGACSIATPAGDLSLTIESGIVRFAPQSIEIDLTGTSPESSTAAVHFEGLSP